jgi:hypothetical protein
MKKLNGTEPGILHRGSIRKFERLVRLNGWIEDKTINKRKRKTKKRGDELEFLERLFSLEDSRK